MGAEMVTDCSRRLAKPSRIVAACAKRPTTSLACSYLLESVKRTICSETILFGARNRMILEQLADVILEEE